MALRTTTEKLESVQAAIAAIEGGAQSYSISGRSLTRANLAELYKQERFLEKKLARESAGGIGIQYAVPEK